MTGKNVLLVCNLRGLLVWDNDEMLNFKGALRESAVSRQSSGWRFPLVDLFESENLSLLLLRCCLPFALVSNPGQSRLPNSHSCI